MAFQTRKSVLFIKEESTAGTLIEPASGSEAITIREGFEFSPQIDSLDNDELSPNIGQKAPVLALENPTCSFSLMLRNSGVEATAPNFDQVIKAALGDKVAAITEKTLAAASTAGSASAAAVIKLASGGSDYQRGHAILLKDSTNGYSIRNVVSIATNDLTTNFNLTAAPSAGVTAGRPILYKPANALPSNSLHLYRANGASVESVAGAKVSTFTMNVAAGEFLSADVELLGTSFFYNQITITSSSKYIDFTDDDGTWAASITEKTYKDPHDLAASLQAAMRAASTEDATVVYSDTTGKFTITSTGTVLSLLWDTGTNTANSIGAKLGFSVAADDTGVAASTGYTSDNAYTLTVPYTPVADTNTNPLVVKNMEVLIGDSYADFACAGAQNFTLSIESELQDVTDICAETGVAEKILNNRTVTCEITLTLAAYESSFFKNYRLGDDVQFAFNGGTKTGGNWDPGKCLNVWMPQAKVSELANSDESGVAVKVMTLTGYVPASGVAEIYFNWL